MAQIHGGNGADTLSGTNDADLITGGGGNDRLSGLGGNDWLLGGAGADQIDGGAGRDTASYADSAVGVTVHLGSGFGEGGDAQGDFLRNIEDLRGSSHADMLFGNTEDNILDGGAGNDTLIDGAGNDWLLGGAGADTLDGGYGYDMARYSGSTAGVQVDLGTGLGHGGDAEGDTLTDIEELRGSTFGDVLTGDALGNILDGASGNDTLAGGDGDDWLLGGAGADALDGGAGQDMVRYSGSTAGVHVDLGAGIGHGGDAEGDTFSNIENVRGTSFADTLIGNSGDNVLDGATGADLLDGAGGVDAARYGDSPVGVVVDLRTGMGHGGDAEGDTLRNIENLIGSTHADTLTGDAGANTIYGCAGDDVINGGDGNDVLFGGDGRNVLTHGDGTDTLSGGNGNDTLYAGDGTSLAMGGAGDDILNGNRLDLYGGTVTLMGGDGADQLLGYYGNDILIGGAGADVLDGGDPPNGYSGYNTADYSGNAVGVIVNLVDNAGTGHGGDAEGDTLRNIDTLIGTDFADVLSGGELYGGAGDDTLTGFIMKGGAGADILNGSLGSTASYEGSAAGVTIDLQAGTAHGGDADGDILHVVSSLVGSAFADVLTGTADNNDFVGGAGDDVLDGGAGGRDDLSGGDGNDILNAARSTLTWSDGGKGNDTISAGAGDDILTGGAGADRIDGGAGQDTASYYDSASGVTINLAAGTAHGGDAEGDVLLGIENIRGTWHYADTLTGDAAANVLEGYSGNDTLAGGAGNDRLDAGDGHDILIGGLGQDLLYGGGGGADTYVFTSVADSGPGESNRDEINSFSGYQGDKIDLHAIDANVTLGGDQAFTAIGGAAFSDHAGELRWADMTGPDVLVEADVNGDGQADFQIVVGIFSAGLQATDFIL